LLTIKSVLECILPEAGVVQFKLAVVELLP